MEIWVKYHERQNNNKKAKDGNLMGQEADTGGYL